MKNITGSHEAIIPKEIYLRVQEELVRRRRVPVGKNGRSARYSCSHYFSQIIICGECGETFRRVHWNNRGCKSIVWRCTSRLESGYGECHARTVNELLLQEVVLKAINQMIGEKTSYIKQLQQNITDVIKSSSATATAEIDAKLEALQKDQIKKANKKDSYDEILKLREERQQLAVDTSVRDD